MKQKSIFSIRLPKLMMGLLFLIGLSFLTSQASAELSTEETVALITQDTLLHYEEFGGDPNTNLYAIDEFAEIYGTHTLDFWSGGDFLMTDYNTSSYYFGSWTISGSIVTATYYNHNISQTVTTNYQVVEHSEGWLRLLVF